MRSTAGFTTLIPHLALLLFTLPGRVGAQTAQGQPNTPPPAVSAPAAAVQVPSAEVNVSRLPINLSRLQRQLRASAERSEQDGSNLKYFVDVYAFAPPLTLFTREDVLGDGAVPGSAPTHSQMIDQNTPEEHRGSNVVRKGGVNLLGKKKK